MAKLRHRDFQILNKNGDFCGMVSRRNLLDARKKKIILVDHNEPSQAVDGLEEAEILEIIDHHRLGSIETMGKSGYGLKTDCRTIVFCDSFGYACIPFTYLYGNGPQSRRKAGTDCRN